MIRLWTLIFKGNSIWSRKASSKTDLKIAIKNVYEHSMLGGWFGFWGGRKGVLPDCNTSFWILWCQLCNTYSAVYHYCQELTLLQQETACWKFGDFISFRRLWKAKNVLFCFVFLLTRKLWKTQVRKCVTQGWNISKYQKTNWRIGIFVTSVKSLKVSISTLYLCLSFLT